MDIDVLYSTILSIGVVSEKLRAAREKLSANGKFRSDVGNLLNEAEMDLRMAKATLAGELGFRLCPQCWPPELIAADRNGGVNCPNCGNISHRKAA